MKTIVVVVALVMPVVALSTAAQPASGNTVGVTIVAVSPTSAPPATMGAGSQANLQVTVTASTGFFAARAKLFSSHVAAGPFTKIQSYGFTGQNVQGVHTFLDGPWSHPTTYYYEAEGDDTGNNSTITTSYGPFNW